MFFPKGLSLDEIIGTEINLQGRWIIPLPHPSGASRWHQIAENRQRIVQAIELIRKRVAEIFSGE